MTGSRRRQADRRADTRAVPMGAARALTAVRGYAETGTQQFVAEAGVSRGALSHHFADKANLFAAATERAARAIVAAVAGARDLRAAVSAAPFEAAMAALPDS